MAHWHDTLPGQILDVDYEALVGDPVAESQRVYAFCGLDWNPDCVEFHRGAWSTTSASASQVQRPIYRSSVELWRHYSLELAPVAKHLADAGVGELE